MQSMIASGSIHVRPEDEAFLRDVLGLPAVAIETLQSEQATRDAQAQLAAKAAAANANKPGGSGADPKVVPIDRSKVAAAAATSTARALTAMPPGTPDPAVSGQSSYRTPAYAQWEYAILRPDVLSRDLDLQTTRTAGEVQDVLHRIDV